MICQNSKSFFAVACPGVTSLTPTATSLVSTSPAPDQHEAWLDYVHTPPPGSPAGLTPLGASSLPSFYFQPSACKAPAPTGSCFARWAGSCIAATAVLGTDPPAVPPCSHAEPAPILRTAAATAPAESSAAEAVGLRDTQRTWI